MQNNLKILIFFFVLSFDLLLNLSSIAQIPQKFNYQGIARDAKGNPMSKQRMSLKITLLPVSDATEGEYEEIQTINTNEFGLYTLQIGNGFPLKGTMSAVKWETGNKYIKVAIDPKGGNDFVDAGTTQLLSVPYAIYADKAGMAKETAGGNRAGAVSTSAAGTGSVNFLTKFTAANTIYNSQVFDNGTNIGIGTTTPAASAKIHIYQNSSSLLEHMRMQNLSATGAGRFTLYSDGANNYSTFTKYGSTYGGGTGYAGINTLYPYANLLAFGNNGVAANDGLGRFLISTAGNAGISLFKGGTSKLKFHADFTTENVGIGGNSAPVSRVHLNNTDGTTMDVRLTNNTTGHTVSDGFEIRTNGNTARLMNRENAALVLGTRDTDRIAVLGSGNVGIGTNTPTVSLDVNGQLRIRGGNPGPGKILTSDSNGTASWSVPTGSGMPQGTVSGQMLYWNGSQWVALNPGAKGSILHMCNGQPSWSPCPPDISTDSVNGITGGTAQVYCTYNLSASSVVTPVIVLNEGFCWSATPNPTLLNNVVTGTNLVTGLTANTTYYVRAFLTYSGGTIYGNQLSFTTGAPTLPVVSTNFGTIIFGGNIQCGGNVANNSGAPITNRGIFYATVPGVSNINANIAAGSGTGSFTVQIPNPVIGQTYYWKAYAVNSAGIAYGQEESMTATAWVPNIGDSLLGGYVFYVLQPGDSGYSPTVAHGLIASPSNLSPLSCDAVSLSMTGVPANPALIIPGGSYVGTASGDLILGTDANQSNLGCTTLTNNVAGKIVVLTRGTCSFEEKAYNAAQAGASGVIICNNEPTYPYLSLMWDYPPNYPLPNIPVMLIDSVTGNTLKLQLLQNIPGTATLTQCTADRWGCAGTSVTPDTNYWDGQLASAAILANCGQTNIAARRCDNLILNGFSDWYLPAVGEMDLLLMSVWFGNLWQLQGSDMQGDFWTSTQYGPDYALTRGFNSSNFTITTYYWHKFTRNKIRAVRKF